VHDVYISNCVHNLTAGGSGTNDAIANMMANQSVQNEALQYGSFQVLPEYGQHTFTLKENALQLC